MTTYKTIIAKHNANGEVEFRCYKDYQPIKNKICNSAGEPILLNEDEINEWEQSAQVFLAFNKVEEDNIRKAVFNPNVDLSAGSINGKDVTEFVEIIEWRDDGDLLGEFAFYKSPSKEEAATVDPEKSQLALWIEVLSFISDNPKGKVLKPIMDKYKITRLPKA